MDNYHVGGLRRLAQRLGFDEEFMPLLQEALRHSSVVNELALRPQDANERLEFLGDAVLELAVSDYLYRHYPEHTEGDLTRLRAALVCEASLASCAQEMGLGELVRLGKGEAASGGAKRPALLADAFEAVIGAVYCYRGLPSARDFIDRYLLAHLDQITTVPHLIHEAKSSLQEWVQAHGKESVTYRLIDQDGPDHAKTFVMQVVIGDQVLGVASAKSKKQAEQLAAREALKKLQEPDYLPSGL